jgi:phosphatidate cytidylyltransferase
MSAALRTFFARLGSTLILWSMCGATVYWAWEWGFWALVLFLAAGALNEFFGLLRGGEIPHFRGLGVVWGTGALLGSLAVGRQFGTDQAVAFSALVLAAGCCAVFCAEIFGKGSAQRGGEVQLTGVAFSSLGLVYVAFLSTFLGHLLYLTPRTDGGVLTGHYYVLYLVAVTKFSDCGAYLVGSLLGRHPMIPRISPKKTWEGFAGALLVPALVSVGLFLWMPEPLGLLHSAGRAAVLGVGLALLAVVGDLAESVLKRAMGAKDSGRFLPGIGGALDLIDSLLFTGPFFYLYLRYCAR